MCVCVFHPNDFAFAWHSFTLIRFSRVHRSVLCSCRRYSFLLHWCVRVCAPQPNESVKFLQIVDWNVYACHNSEAVGTMFYWLAIRNRNRNRSMNVNRSLARSLPLSLGLSISLRAISIDSFRWFIIYAFSIIRHFEYTVKPEWLNPNYWLQEYSWELSSIQQNIHRCSPVAIDLLIYW